MVVVSVAVEKGGAGKTTTVGNLAAALAEIKPKRRVLCLDWDPQANLTRWLLPEVPKDAHLASVVDQLTAASEHVVDPHRAVHQTDWGFAILAGHRLLADRVAAVPRGMEYFILRQVLTPLRDDYDIVLIDCPPRLDVFSLNALAAADQLVIPIELGLFGAEGLSNTLDTVNMVRRHLNTRLSVAGIVATKADLRTRHQEAVLAAIRQAAAQRHLRFFEPPVPQSIVLPEACYNHVPIQYYRTRNMMARQCTDVYAKIARELLKVLREEVA